MEIRVGWQAALWSLLLGFLLSTVIAWSYVITHQGLSYSRSFVQTVVLSGVVSALVMLAIGNDIARGLGLVGALTVVRFRTTLKDSRDLIFVFASLGAGVACGVQSFPVAVMGIGIFCLAAIYTSWSGFGSKRAFDAVLRLQLPSDPEIDRACQAVLRKHCRTWALISLREAGSAAPVQEHAYHVKLADPQKKGALVADLRQLSGLSGVTLLMQDTSLEP